MHTFSPTPTQYEIESWIFPHPSVRRLQDASKPGPQRHSLHAVNPRVTVTKEEERARLKKGHRRWHSNENRGLHGGPHRSKEGKGEGEGESVRTGGLKTTPEWSGPMGHHSGLTIHDGKEEASQRNRPSPYRMPFQTVSEVSDSWSRSGNVGARSSELLGGQVSPSSYRQHKEP